MGQESEDGEDDCRFRIDCPVLVTERLVMRPLHEHDIEDLALLANNRRVAEMTSRIPHPYGEKDARDFVARSAELSSECRYAVTLADSGRFIGCGGLNAREEGLEVGYWLGEPHWGAGYGTEIAHALTDLAFRATEIDVLHAACRVTNHASRRVLHKCGFQHSGQGMMTSVTAGQIAVERYQLERSTWVSLRSWGASA